MKDMNKLTPPDNGHVDGQYTVMISVGIKDIFDISESEASFTVRYYLSLIWNDEKFIFTPYLINSKPRQRIQLPLDIIQERGMFVYERDLLW